MAPYDEVMISQDAFIKLRTEKEILECMLAEMCATFGFDKILSEDIEKWWIKYGEKKND